MKGKVFLIGAGPGDPELLAVKAVRILQAAEAVLHDDLVSPEVLALVPRKAQVYNVGKRCGQKQIKQEEINFLMAALADAGRQVVRLKSGDPMIFGRAGEEIESLRKAGVSYEVIPGITTALGAAASTEIPLTHRKASSAVVFITAHQAEGSEAANWSKLAGSGATLVIYMPGRNYKEISTKLEQSGLSAQTPCALISRVSTAQQQTHRTVIGDLHESPRLPSPTLLIVGEVVRFSNFRAFTNEIPFDINDPAQIATLSYSGFANDKERPLESHNEVRD
jgi:uroporphyrin-III C-methyltransferase